VVEAVVLYIHQWWDRAVFFYEIFFYSFSIYFALEGGGEERELLMTNLVCFEVVGLGVFARFETLPFVVVLSHYVTGFTDVAGLAVRCE
jgi:hypothetical protein